jgi:hypothetical protein
MAGRPVCWLLLLRCLVHVHLLRLLMLMLVRVHVNVLLMLRSRLLCLGMLLTKRMPILPMMIHEL